MLHPFAASILFAFFSTDLLLFVSVALLASPLAAISTTAALSLSRPNCVETTIESTAAVRLMSQPSSNKAHSSDEADGEPRWCPEQQIYLGGVVPQTQSSAALSSLLEENGGWLRIFGYGSLCWNPGEGATLSKEEEGVTRSLGRAIGWRRCWAQRSTDHRGTPVFPGIVCTLLNDMEVREIKKVVEPGENGEEDDDAPPSPSMTEGMIYSVPPALADECLAELDFREKGGYARDIIDVLDDTTGQTIKALLYRGTPDNPAFWKRALLDLPFAAATIAVAVGPSGPNDEYLFHLEKFLSDASNALSLSDADHVGDSDTNTLASMTRSLQRHGLHFLFGSGSNQHGQLLLSPDNAALKDSDEVHELTELALVVPKSSSPRTAVCSEPTFFSSNKDKQIQKPTPSPFPGPSRSKILQLDAGGGHSALLLSDGRLYLWGWNEQGQLGHKEKVSCQNQASPLPLTMPLRDLLVEKVALGHAHTLVLENGSGFVFAFGDNARGQAGGHTKQPRVTEPATPICLVGERCISIAAGVFHSAAITADGELVTFGCRKFGQCLPTSEIVENTAELEPGSSCGRWRPIDGSRLIQVACGRRHTIVLDENGRVWSLGNDNAHGQLGRQSTSASDNELLPHLVEGALGKKGSGCVSINCGWSHNVAMVPIGDMSSSSGFHVYGWGRNDKGQLGTGSLEGLASPSLVHKGVGDRSIFRFCCGAESSMALDDNGDIWGCGWNEHGNLANGKTTDVLVLARIAPGASMPRAFGTSQREKLIAAGGAHFVTTVS